eukprot:2322203-Amphidinium_carterae.1
MEYDNLVTQKVFDQIIISRLEQRAEGVYGTAILRFQHSNLGAAAFRLVQNIIIEGRGRTAILKEERRTYPLAILKRSLIPY